MSDILANFWRLTSSEQKAVRQIVDPSCQECGKTAPMGRKCWFCDGAICQECTRDEWQGDMSIIVCKSCHQAGKELGLIQKGRTT